MKIFKTLSTETILPPRVHPPLYSSISAGASNNSYNLNKFLLAGAAVAITGICSNTTSAEESIPDNKKIHEYRQKLLKKGKLMTKKMHVFNAKDHSENFEKQV